MFPAKTKAPADALCEKLWAYAVESGANYPKSLNANSCPYIFKERGRVFKIQKDRLADLAQHLDYERVGSSSLPRDDYHFMWSLVKVNKLNYFRASTDEWFLLQNH